MRPSWPRASIEEATSAIIDYRGKTPKKTTSGIPLVTAKVVKDGRILPPDEFIAEAEYDSWMRRGMPKKGDVLITTEAPLGEVAQLHSSAVALAQRIILLRGRTGLLDNTFLKFALMSAEVQEQLSARASGTTVLGIKQSELRRVLLPIPPIQEQESIAAVLGALDDKIELNRKMNETLEQMAQAIFKSWFIDFDGHTEFQDSPLGPIPKGWSARALYDSATFINGAAYRDFHFCARADGLPVIKIAELKSGITQQTKFTNRELDDKYRINSGEILFSWSGNPDTSIDTFVWTRGPAWLNQHIFRVVPHSNAQRAFVYYLLKSLRPTFAELARNKQTTGLGHVTAQDMKKLLTVLPSDPVITRFNAVAQSLLERSLGTIYESQTLTELRDALLPKLISGELRINDAEKTVGEAT